MTSCNSPHGVVDWQMFRETSSLILCLCGLQPHQHCNLMLKVKPLPFSLYAVNARHSPEATPISMDQMPDTSSGPWTAPPVAHLRMKPMRAGGSSWPPRMRKGK